jgi:hypothetical protein
MTALMLSLQALGKGAIGVSSMSDYELAQLNIGQLKARIDSPLLAEFVANLDRINRLADSSDGFRWRLMTDDGNATSLRPFGDDVLVNMSVWSDLDALRRFVYRSSHAQILKRREEWFVPSSQSQLVLWWIPSGHRPTLSEASLRLEQLRQRGPSSAAFTFRNAFPAPAVEPCAK